MPTKRGTFRLIGYDDFMVRISGDGIGQFTIGRGDLPRTWTLELGMEFYADYEFNPDREYHRHSLSNFNFLN